MAVIAMMSVGLIIVMVVTLRGPRDVALQRFRDLSCLVLGVFATGLVFLILKTWRTRR